jgi:hypothetical protein
MVSELFTVYGESDGVAVTDDFPLYADLIDYTIAAPEYLRIPQGMKVKIWAIRVNGNLGDTAVTVNYTHDVTAGIPVYVAINTDILDNAVDSRFSDDYRKPIILRGFAGTEAVKFTWTQPAAVVANVEIDVEYCD